MQERNASNNAHGDVLFSARQLWSHHFLLLFPLIRLWPERIARPTTTVISMIVTCNHKLVWHIVAIIFSAAGSLILFVDRFIIQEEVRREVTLNNGSQYLNEWRNDTTPVSAKFYVFNITNSDSVESGNEEDIRLDAVGPFVFDVKRQRNILFMNDSVIEYQPIDVSVYDASAPENSPLDLSVNMANVPLAVIMRKAREAGFLATKACSLLAVASLSRVFTKRPVRQILFEGYKDPFFALVKMMEKTARLPGADKIPDYFSIMKDVSRPCLARSH